MLDEAVRSTVQSPAILPQLPARACKIALYGFGSEPVVHRNLLELATKDGLPLTWCAILPTPHYRSMMREILPPRGDFGRFS